MQELMTIKDTANYLRMSVSTVYKLVEKERIPASKVGGAWRFRKDTLDDWLDSQSRRTRGVVLIVDDDARVRDVLRDIIAEQGHQVVSAESGLRAIEAIQQQHFDLILLDLVLPDVSGVEVLRRLKAQDERAVVVVITAYGDYPIALEAMSLGPLWLIRKPFLVADVTQVLDMLTRVRR